MKMFITASMIAFVSGQSLFADTLPAPKEDVVLTLSGALSNETSDGVVQLDLQMLKDMPQIEFSTETIWLEGAKTFTGVSLKAVLEYSGFEGSKIEAVALNDYKIEIPSDSLEDDAPIVAYLLDGKEMSARGKGPLWIVYPYDEDAKYRTEVIYSRSIWQLDRINSVK